jgi:lysozyme
MKTSTNGITLIKEFEGFKESSYQCSAGVWTIGYGTTVFPEGHKVLRGDRIIKKSAEEFLRHDLIQFETQVNRLVQVPLTQNQFDALVSFTYNLGGGALERSTLLKKLNDGNYSGAAKEFMRWNKAGGKVLKGLTNRRKREMELFLTYVGDAFAPDPNNTPLRNSDLPLPTAYQQHGIDSVEERKRNPTAVTAGAGGVIAGGVAIVEYLPYITDILHVVSDLDWRVVVVCAIIALTVSGFIWWRRR